jgi:protein-S-isoprenylcysteine O-methyltransferase Ste14
VEGHENMVISEVAQMVPQVTDLTSNLARSTAFYTVIGCWFAFAAAFAVILALRKRTPGARESKRDRTAMAGMVLEAVSFYMVWSQRLQRKQFAPVVPESRALAWALAVVAVLIAAGSVWLVGAALRRLGKQWAVAARLVEGHALVQNGPYRFVRNPIYLGMFGMMLATGLITTQWIPLLGASVLFIAGTYIRVRSEERLLREAFGAEFEAYARRVPALIPGIY